MTHKDSNIDQLYQEGNKAQPPKALDESILTQAEQSNQPTRQSRLRPWLAAASVLFTVPFLWLILQQPEIQQARQESLQPMPAPTIPVTEDSVQPDVQARSDQSAEDTEPQDTLTEHGKLTVTGSRIKRRDAESDTAGLQAPDTAEKRQAATKQSQDFQKLKAEQEASAEDNMQSLPASYSSTETQSQEKAVLTELIKQLKPMNLSDSEQVLWQDFQRHIDKQQYAASLKSLQKLKKTHSAPDFTALEKQLKQLSKD